MVHIKQPNGEENLQVDERRLLPYITKAMQELSAKVEALETEVKELKEALNDRAES